MRPTPLVRVARQLLAHDALALAGQLAYFFVLFLFPFLIFMVSLVGLVVDNPEFTAQFEQEYQRVLSVARNPPARKTSGTDRTERAP